MRAAASLRALGLLLALTALLPPPSAAQAPPLGLPALPQPPDQRLAALGARLFFDKRLSSDGTIACASCHDPAQAFTQRDRPTPSGVAGARLRRNAPTLINAAYYDRLHQDGGAASLEEQVWRPLLAPTEMGNAGATDLLARLRALPDYAAAFGEPVNRAAVGAALAAYQRSLIAGASRFDRWWFGGEDDAISPEERAGFALFRFRAGCAQCHEIGDRHALFTDQRFHNIGTGGRPDDLGRMEITQAPEDRWRYRTPGLRNVALTAPYMHDGSLATLEDVVAFYDRGGGDDPDKAQWLFPLGLSEGERRALVAFLKTLTGANAEALIRGRRP